LLSSERRRAGKLQLHRETVRSLDSEMLERVRGGIDATQDCPTWNVVTTVTAPVTQKLDCGLT
jgi:hypothetical protein